MISTTYEQIDIDIRVKEYASREPYLSVEQKDPPGGGTARDLKPFAFDFKPGTPCGEADALADAMRCVITHILFE